MIKAAFDTLQQTFCLSLWLTEQCPFSRTRRSLSSVLRNVVRHSISIFLFQNLFITTILLKLPMRLSWTGLWVITLLDSGGKCLRPVTTFFGSGDPCAASWILHAWKEGILPAAG